VFGSLVHALKRSADDAVKTSLVAVVVGALGVVALFFFTLAAYLWGEIVFGGVVTAVALGVVYLVAAIVLWAASRERRRLLQDRAAALAESDTRRAWEENAFASLPAIGDLLRLTRSRSVVPALALSALAIAAFQQAWKQQSDSKRSSP
jgi:hypothetical protein